MASSTAHSSTAKQHAAPRRTRRTRTAAAICAALALALFSVVAAASPAGAATGTPRACASRAAAISPRLTLHGRTASLARPAYGTCTTRIGTGDPAGGSPPLVFHHGRVMAVPGVGNKVVITPIFWTPTGYTFDPNYESLIVRYLQDAAAASGSNNIYATNTEYKGSNGAVTYRLAVGATITDPNPLPTQECTVDTGAVYSDNTPYSACIDNDQVIAETQSVVAAHSLPSDLGHIYVMFTPKGVESCFYSDAQAITQGGNQCTINASGAPPLGTSAYCAYHSFFGAGKNSIYAMMPFPIYSSPLGPTTCGSEATLPTTESPNNNPDADVEISPLSHELSEAITDPNLNAWYDVTGFENGDECAYTYGATHGGTGKLYNQTINGHHYLTQEEFSNNDFFATGGGCLQGEPRPVAGANVPKSGTHNGGTLVAITGKYFPQQATVLFGTKPGTNIKHVSGTKLTVRSPQHAKGTVNIFVKTLGGTSAKKATVKFTFN